MMAEAATELEAWPDALNNALASQAGPIRNIIVLRETESTQAAARRLHVTPGTAVVAGRQTCGRGRLGAEWLDPSGDGVALTAVFGNRLPERLSLAAAVAAAVATETLIGREVWIKWPNDILVDRRKLAGVLVETTGDRALVGIGLNVRQQHWPSEIRDRAISLAQLGCDCSRLDAMLALMCSLNEWVEASEDALRDAFQARNVLQGREAVFSINGTEICGQVCSIDPLRGLEVDTGRGLENLPAGTTRVLQWS